jgi:hypothetical protein
MLIDPCYSQEFCNRYRPYMDILCRFGHHLWQMKPTARPGVTVYRCARGSARVRTERGRLRRKKRHYFLAAMMVSLLLWYVIVALGLTGHTKLLWGAKHVTRGADHVVLKADRKLKRVLGVPQQSKLGKFRQTAGRIAFPVAGTKGSSPTHRNSRPSVAAV